MAEKNVDERPRPVPPPRVRRTPENINIYDQVCESVGATQTAQTSYYERPLPVPPQRTGRTYEKVNIYDEVYVPMGAPVTGQTSYDGQYSQPWRNSRYDVYNLPAEFEEVEYLNHSRPEGKNRLYYQQEICEEQGYVKCEEVKRDVKYSYAYTNDYSVTLSKELETRMQYCKARPKEFLKVFELTKDEVRTEEEAFIITHLLRASSKSPVLDGKLDQLALFACCNSSFVVKRALDALLNEIFLSITDYPTFRCCNVLNAEQILRESIQDSLKFDHWKAKCQRMTTYAWLITLVLVMCTKEELVEIQPKVRGFDATLDALLPVKKHTERNILRYGVLLVKEVIKQIGEISQSNDSRQSLHQNIKKCVNILSGKLEKQEVVNLGKALWNSGSWLDFHVCLVFLQDLPKLHQFHGNRKPVILIQMLIADYRQRCRNNTVKKFLKIGGQPNIKWRFETLVYRVLLRLITTSKNNEIIDQVLTGQQGCDGILRRWYALKSENIKDEFAFMFLEELCKRAVFYSPKRRSFIQFFKEKCKFDGKMYIESVSILWLLSMYKDKVLEILPESRACLRQSVVTRDVLMSAKKCLMKLQQHSKDDVLSNDPVNSDLFPLRNEIEILRVLNAEPKPCPYVVQLLGSSTKIPMHMIIERTPNGNLLNYLHDFDIPPESRDLLKMALDVCKAMVFLSEQKIIHRDLCAKNCFVFLQDGTILTKLGDFHLAIQYCSLLNPPPRQDDVKRSAISHVTEESFEEFAVRWTAVEALRFGEFSPASDVWSFGVLLVEIFTFGSKPYVNMPSGISLDRDEKVCEFVLDGGRLELHPKIPESIQQLIESTMEDAHDRPTFADLQINLQQINFDDDLYKDPAHYRVRYGRPYDTLISIPIDEAFTHGSSETKEKYAVPKQKSKPIDQAAPSTGCKVNGCFGQCVNASDIATSVSEDGNESYRTKEFISTNRSTDIQQLSDFTHPFIAVISDTIMHTEKVELITEVGDLGSLEEFINLYGCRSENAMRYIYHIAKAASFLHEERFVHRNLRAASVYIYSKGNTAKLACFARVRKLNSDTDEQSSTLPVKVQMPEDSLRWSSPEVLCREEYNTASDVWAFAVLIWEMFTLIDKESNDGDVNISHLPYHPLETKEQILSYLEKERLGKPKSCPQWLYDLMLQCWKYNVTARLKCEDIAERIKQEKTFAPMIQDCD